MDRARSCRSRPAPPPMTLVAGPAADVVRTGSARVA
jgi:hypothetical protein